MKLNKFDQDDIVGYAFELVFLFDQLDIFHTELKWSSISKMVTRELAMSLYPTDEVYVGFWRDCSLKLIRHWIYLIHLD